MQKRTYSSKETLKEEPSISLIRKKSVSKKKKKIKLELQKERIYSWKIPKESSVNLILFEERKIYF